jgi:CheY-like chemotaxis protein
VPRILVIDDEEGWRLLMRTVLRKAGYTVETASDGRAGVERYAAHPADLVITDLMMARSDGFEVIRDLKAAHPEVKILAISGGTPEFDWSEPSNLLETAQFLGVDQVLQKSFDREALLSVVQQLLEPSAS